MPRQLSYPQSGRPSLPSDRVLGRFAGSLPESVCKLVYLEGNAPRMISVRDGSLPAFLRTPAHSIALKMRSSPQLAAAEDVKHFARIEAERQAMIADRRLAPGAFTFAVGETALLRCEGFPHQLLHILTLLGSNSGVDLRLIPNVVPVHPGMAYPFTVFPETPVGTDPAVFVEGPRELHMETDPEIVKGHLDAADLALRHALSPAESIGVVMDMYQLSLITTR